MAFLSEIIKNVSKVTGSLKTAAGAAGNRGVSSAGGSGSSFTGSVSGVNTYTQDQQAIKDQMNANSKAWHTADDAGKKQLEEANKQLAAKFGGSVSFDSGTGTWSGSAQQSVQQPAQKTQVDDYSNYLEEMYAAQKRQALAELNAAYEKNVSALDRAGYGLDRQYQDARNSAAGASELSKRNFAEYAAASGLNSGAGGQAELARNVALQNNLNSIDTAQADAYADLELQRANAEIEYNNAIAQAQAQGDYELAAALYQEKVRVNEAYLEQQNLQRQYELQKYQLEYQAGRDQVSDQRYEDSLVKTQRESEREQKAQWGQQFLNMGLMLSQDMLDAMGMTTEDAQRVISYVQQQTAVKAGTGSGSFSGGSGSAMTLTTAKQAASAGAFNDEVLAVLRANGYTDDMLQAIYGYTGQAGQQAGAGNDAGNSASYNAILTAAQNLYRNDYSGAQIQTYLQSRIDSGFITEAEANRIAETIMGG